MPRPPASLEQDALANSDRSTQGAGMRPIGLRAAWRRLVPVICALVLLCACTRVNPPATRVGVGIVNGTTIPVSLVVNGQQVGDYPAGQPGPTIDPSTLPPLPWTVEARSPSGRVLLSLPVAVGEVRMSPDGQTDMQAVSAPLACGPLMIWVGAFIPNGRSPGPTAERPDPC